MTFSQGNKKKKYNIKIDCPHAFVMIEKLDAYNTWLLVGKENLQAYQRVCLVKQS